MSRKKHLDLTVRRISGAHCRKANLRTRGFSINKSTEGVRSSGSIRHQRHVQHHSIISGNYIFSLIIHKPAAPAHGNSCSNSRHGRQPLPYCSFPQPRPTQPIAPAARPGRARKAGGVTPSSSGTSRVNKTLPRLREDPAATSHGPRPAMRGSRPHRPRPARGASSLSRPSRRRELRTRCPPRPPGMVRSGPARPAPGRTTGRRPRGEPELRFPL